MFCIGLTGNIASGKSTAIKHFQSLGIPVIVADDVAREITARGQPVLEEIKRRIGPSVITAQGDLDRGKLRRIIVSDEKQRLWLENLLHPLIRQRIEQKISEVKGPYCVIEIPLLLNKEDYSYLNRILAILVDDKTLIARVMSRDQHSRDFAAAILALQPDENARRRIADDIIENNGSVEEFKKAINGLHQQYLHYSSQY
ncbi:dephospho-CoA kinase [Legionella spiritensis]|uniref:Dephospho-CoA kinase n=1 Tax=Legionella spiritensis TaxID=452 RepID=A0A0W0Z4N2_LEGSP|nr:dephospho-CoA kinase [Legionella spiritensis]KTD64065.1 dephospho-CoA kinase [Legionella spiritensis]SNV37535.1 dephospho-CoA kinase [Legionella spiritensis]